MTNPQQPNPPGQQAGYPPHPGSHTTPPPQFQQPPPPGYGPQPGQPYVGPGGPPPKKDKGNRTVLIILGVVVIGIIAMCGIGGALVANAPTTTTAAVGGVPEPASPSEEQPAGPGPGSSANSPAPIGTEIEVAKGLPIKVTSAVMDGDAEMAKGNQFMKPETGKQYVIVDITATNNTGRPTTIGQHVKLQLLGSSGVAIQQSFFPEPPNELDTMAQLQPGVTVSGRLAYQVPEAELSSVVLLAEPQFTVDTNEDQRFLAIQ